MSTPELEHSGRHERRRLDYVPLDEVTGAERNVKRHDERGIASSLGKFGYVEPVVVDERTGRLVAGHGRIEQLRALRAKAGVSGRAAGGPPEGVLVEGGRWLVPVVRGWASANDAEAEAYLVASNRLTERGGWDEAGLAQVLADLEQHDVHLTTLAGFTDTEVADLLERLAAEEVPVTVPGGADPEAVGAAPTEPLSQLGEVIELGPHRLVVGDASEVGVLEAAMGGLRAAAMWTDPPYGVNYVGKTPRALTIASDDPDGAVVLFARVLEAVHTAAALLPGAAFYVAHAPGEAGIDFQHLLRQGPWRFQQSLVWVKDAMVLGHMDHHFRHEALAAGNYEPGERPDGTEDVPQHEVIGYGRYRGRPGARGPAKGRGRGGWYGGNAATTVFQVPRPKASRAHPTMKPLALIVPQLANVTRRGQHVLDPFGGSGSTLLAAHSLGLVAHVVEVSPAYSDVIASRFQQVTGIVPVVNGKRRRYPALTEPPETPEELAALGRGDAP